MELLHVGLLSWLLFLLFLGALVFVFILLMAHIGYSHSDKASWICFCSSSNSSWLEHMSLALCSNELITLYLLDMAWWLSHLRYWLVWVGFLYTLFAGFHHCWVWSKCLRMVWTHHPWCFQLWIWCGCQESLYDGNLFLVWFFQDDKGIIHISFP